MISVPGIFLIYRRACMYVCYNYLFSGRIIRFKLRQSKTTKKQSDNLSMQNTNKNK